MLLETEDLLLKKAEFTDWQTIYRNVWSKPETARFMAWRVTTDEEEAQNRMLRTALSCGFTCQYTEKKTDLRNGEPYELEIYHKMIS